MKHPHRIREIAAQAGLSQATVDRVLHHRGGVRESTIRDVHQAIAALDRRHDQPPLPARTFTVDLIVADRTRAGAALRAELPALRPAVIRPRLRPAADPLTELAKVARSQSHGLILEAAESPELVEAIGRLEIPVVTLNTDLPASKRVAHVGLAEPEAGATAAYLIDQWLADRAGDVLIVLPATAADSPAGPAAIRSPAVAERFAGFRAELRTRSSNRRLRMTDSTHVRATLAANPSIRAVYTPERGHTAAVIDAFAAEHRNYDAFVAHDLDDENTGLLRTGRLSAVLHHDVRSDLRAACLAILQSLGAVPGPVRSTLSSVQVVTPPNLPSA
ncbi:LacI family DNA-binding transcriptional regulator [Paractinoplanes hotanensis]|uniref:LacI family DNA-binding transcriptional regulator n=1 Tax=Paractinoplanes hotanensis TaxID=2906497 RepID=A0ABT0YDF1_9ACTN|nr:LacI family DNA-binding transcriptional regulator [Actinoplanes hotanensis]MCM4083507.1 LacI family DNA-binding transcriptional regulator [Actinoplanes hotanensis]